MIEELVYAVDIGGTKIDLGIVNHLGEIPVRQVISTPKSPLKTVNLIAAYYHHLLENLDQNQEITAVGIGTPNVR